VAVAVAVVHIPIACLKHLTLVQLKPLQLVLVALVLRARQQIAPTELLVQLAAIVPLAQNFMLMAAAAATADQMALDWAALAAVH
jgi:hypothetical protein